MMTGTPANASIPRSFRLSPIAITCRGSMPSAAARHASARPLVASDAVTSTSEKSRRSYSVRQTETSGTAWSAANTSRMVATAPLNITWIGSSTSAASSGAAWPMKCRWRSQ